MPPSESSSTSYRRALSFTLFLLASLGMNSAYSADISGEVATTGGAPICALVLASGRNMFSCNPVGKYSFTDLPVEADGSINLQVYADGFLPFLRNIRQFGAQPPVIMLPSVDDGLTDTRPLDGTYSILRMSYFYDYDYAFISDTAFQNIQVSGTMNIAGNRYVLDINLVVNGQSNALVAGGTIREDGIGLIFDEFTSEEVAMIEIERGGKLTLFENATGNGGDYAFVMSFKKLSSTSALRSQAISSDSAPLTMNTIMDVLDESAALEARAKMSDG